LVYILFGKVGFGPVGTNVYIGKRFASILVTLTKKEAINMIALTEPFLRLWESIVNILPGIVGALIILVIGYIIGWIASWIVEKVLTKIQFNKCVIGKTNVCKATGNMDLSKIIGLITKWGIFALFLASAASVVQLAGLAFFLQEVAFWIPNLIAAVIIALVALIAGDYASYKIEETKIKSSRFVGLGAKVVIVFLGAVIALKQIGIDVSIVEHSFLVILAGVMLALALAFGLGFAEAVKAESKDLVKKIKKNL